ncbi:MULTISPECIES: T9SS type A sorting domain-containing protein [unclassified Lentimicrobium]|uniref:T9SS type A sorting domain-containing protein n=1 Tax=unclassified Lentimicrobium TaxID=2677434 RepID=UPI00155507D4|nr:MULTISPECIES: T9SS type A sorting domain-containing protein [unclassified Lentimicrobium]NPD45109.1 T9SS type A sorting domain-containing protein [Lentimicrobium sp. S6]NPD85373.1 T9SS type A sorting domain-containing protein [Lentimicrobium sp. L6]
MKKILLLLISLFTIQVMAQYSTPGNNGSYTLGDLVDISAGAITADGDGFSFNESIIISASDTLKVEEDVQLSIAIDKLWTIEGVLLVTADEFGITSSASIGNFEGIRFDNSSASVLKNTMIQGCGGIKVVDSDMLIQNCYFRGFGQEYSSGAINLFDSNPIIRDCDFQNNAGAAISSGANSSSSPQIINNNIVNNVTVNSNTPQINLGTSDGISPIVIDSNYISGSFDNAGGIAVSNLVGGSSNSIITNNYVLNNRYGIAQIGTFITSIIAGNIMADNNIQNDPMLGGSGLNFYGDETNTSVVTENVIYGNLWGVTIQLNASPDLGDGTENSPGKNRLYNNGNGGDVFALYNNTPNPINAIYNFWGTTELAEAEDAIYHETDDASLGLVSYEPMWTNPVGIQTFSDDSKQSISPNPATNYFTIDIEEKSEMIVYNQSGQFVNTLMVSPNQRIDISEWEKGIYILKLANGSTKKLVVL